MGSSAARKGKKATKTGEKRVLRKAAERSVEVADAVKVREAFGQVDKHIQGLVKVFQHNAEVIQVGFYKNDIWLEVFKLVLTDLANSCVVFGDPELASERAAESVALNWQHYWDRAKVNVEKSMEEAKKAKAEAPPETPLIAREDDETPIEFGGDYASTESAETGQAAAQRDDSGEEQREARDAAAPLPAVSQPG
ncbi:MAG: hypothetical protein WC372_08180 [Candidatus Neomarinimicrobiota bacterium]|jgi:hypothetical protein